MNLKNIFTVAILSVFSFSCNNILSEKTVKGPNIVFIMTDDHAYQAISTYNSGLISTPNIDRIAEEGIRFDRAYVTNSICAPSRAVILTGKFSHLNGVTGNSQTFDGSQPTFPKILQENGYQTALVGKWHLKSHPTGFDYWNVLPGQGDYYSPDFIKQGKDTVYSGYVTDVITDLSIEWLENRDENKPFCLMVQHKAPHRSWMPDIQNLDLFNDRDFEFPSNFNDDLEGKEALQDGRALTIKDVLQTDFDFKIPFDSLNGAGREWFYNEYQDNLNRLSPEGRKKWDDSYRKEAIAYDSLKNDPEKLVKWKFQRYMEDYLRCVMSVDESIGEISQWLKNNDMDQNTVIIYTSDQGMFLGEHGFFDKRLMYEETFRTPLIIKYPEHIKKGLVTTELVQNLDIAPTILDIAGAKIPDDMQGEPLRTIWEDVDPNWRDEVYYHYYEKGFLVPPHYGVRTDRYKLIHFYDPVDTWEFYDLEVDPNEMNNLYWDASCQQTIEELKSELIELKLKYKLPEE
ncbi:MAG: sulfatase [Bacteroidota bacterium]